MLHATPQILDGKAVAAKILDELKRTLQEQALAPKLSIIQIGNNPASTQYVALKKRKASDIGIATDIVELPLDTTEESILQKISFNAQTSHGIMVQLPLPSHLNTAHILDAIAPHQDVDGLSYSNLHLLERGDRPLFTPAVAMAVATILSAYDISLPNKNILIIGKGNYVGKPIGELLQLESPTGNITWIDEFTTSPATLLASAEIVISCVGKPHLYNANQLKPSAILIDVGTSEDPKTGKIVGDFDISQSAHLQAYTPVPGGIGPLTVASLLKNTVTSAQ